MKDKQKDNYDEQTLLKTMFDFLAFVKSLEGAINTEEEKQLLNQDFELIKNYSLLYLTTKIDVEDIEELFKEMHDYYVKKNMS